jgi:hypothetical protein
MVAKPMKINKERVYKYIRIAIDILFIILMISFFEWGGLIYIGIYYLLFSIYAVWKARDQVVLIKHATETAIWGKPLKTFKKGELANTKVKIVWRKDNELDKHRKVAEQRKA